MDYKKEYERWLKNADAETVAELEAIRGDEKEIEERFYKNLEFGTAGLRGIIGAGSNRMNSYVVGQATQGLANQLKKTNPEGAELSVAIAYDSRIKSDEFARVAAAILAANGIKVYLFDELKPVPELSFTISYKKTTAGIVITASHNPAKYNGYKVYGADGAQLNPELAAIVLEEIEKTDMFSGVKTCDFDTAVADGRIELIGDEVENAYLDCVAAQSINPELIRKAGNTLTFVYTPFHGSGNKPVRKILKRMGFDNVVVVKEQELPDGRFPTVKSPNPENKEGFTLAIEYAKKCGADLIIGTDPDADRVGIIVKSKDGEYNTYTGNQVGAMLTEYILSSLSERGELPNDAYVVKTIVTTNLAAAICDSYGVEMKEVLTGFKFIGEKIKESEETGRGTYILGFEESYGYLKGTYARDKDAVVATMLIAEMTLWCKERGSSLAEFMDSIYEKYGYYTEYVESVVMEGKDGSAKISGIMEKLRSSAPAEIGGKKVLAVRDYQTSVRTETNGGKTDKILLPKSNVLYFELADGNNFIVRPSGTEPKIKLYCLLRGDTKADADVLLSKVKEDIAIIVK
ncbi:MAG: phospho-sugar mutase [Clostridia bacterium]|nr:phospho-sugar mutase [Clostridia bacterium]